MKTGCYIFAVCFAAFSCRDRSAVNNTASPAKAHPVITDSTLPEEITANLVFNTATFSPAKDSVKVDLLKGIHFKVAVPSGYNIRPAMEGLRRPRFLTMSPDGRLFCTDMFDKSDNEKGCIYIFDNWNDTAKKFQRAAVYLDRLHNPNQVAFLNNYIYVAETHRLVRYKYTAGDMHPTDTGEVIATFPAYGLSYKYGGWHLTRSIAAHNDKLYISIGSSCNACIEQEEIRATIIEMDADGTNVKFYARGLRNSVGIKWLGNELWATTMGRDLIGPDKPEELFLRIKENGYYGWPFYFQYRNKVYEDAQFKDSLKASWVKEPEVGYAGFKAHSAPLGFEYMKDFDDPYLRNAVLVCLHGSTTVSRMRGNAVVRAEGGNKYSEVVSGFLQGKTEKERYGRPCDILMKDNRSFYVTDDHNGVLYYVWKQIKNG